MSLAGRFSVLLILLIAHPALAGPTPFRAVYKAEFKGFPVTAKGIYELKPLKEGRFEFSSEAHSILGSISEHSLFTWQGTQLVPEQYQYRRTGIGKNRTALLSFDWSKARVKNDVQGKVWTMDIAPGTLDKLSYQLQMRQDLQNGPALQSAPLNGTQYSYPIADGGRIKRYDFEVQAEEWLVTPLGRIKTVRVARIQPDTRRSTVFWLAQEWEFLLVRLKQIENESDGFELTLESAEMGGKPLLGEAEIH